MSEGSRPQKCLLPTVWTLALIGSFNILKYLTQKRVTLPVDQTCCFAGIVTDGDCQQFLPTFNDSTINLASYLSPEKRPYE